MPTTTRGLRYPSSSAAPNVPQDVQNLASDVDGLIGQGWVTLTSNTTYSASPTGTFANMTGLSGFSVTVPTTKTLTVQFRAPAVNVTGGIVNIRLNIAGTNYDGAVYSIGSGTVWIPARHEETVQGTGSSMSIAVQAQLSSGSGVITAASIGAVVLRYRVNG